MQDAIIHKHRTKCTTQSINGLSWIFGWFLGRTWRHCRHRVGGASLLQSEQSAHITKIWSGILLPLCSGEEMRTRRGRDHLLELTIFRRQHFIILFGGELFTGNCMILTIGLWNEQ